MAGHEAFSATHIDIDPGQIQSKQMGVSRISGVAQP